MGGGLSVAEWDLDAHVREWRDHLARRAAIAADADELESHLRDRVDGLIAAGLAPDEAFLIGVKRMGAVDDLSDEFAREHSDRLWKQLLPPEARPERTGASLRVALAFAAAAAVLAKLPGLLAPLPALTVLGTGLGSVVNGVILVLAVLAAMFAWRTRARAGAIVAVAAVFVLVALALNLFPFVPGDATWWLAAVHAPIVLWLCAGVLYMGGDWSSGRARMDLVRFTGEWVAYYALIALGGGVLIALTVALFGTVGVDATGFALGWMLPCGAAGAVIVAAWLVEAKQAVIENIAPVLTKVFTPLFALLLVALIVVGLLQGSLVEADRDILILFDITLIVVLALLLYAMSARDPLARPGWFERLQLVLLASALVVDALVLIAMLARIGEYGVSANKLASLGLNLLLLANLSGAAWLQVRFITGRTRFGTLERWQTGFLPAYLAWALVVVAVFPPAFGFA